MLFQLIFFVFYLKDKVASVRIQAVNALHRLQDPSDEDCKIIEGILFVQNVLERII